MVDSARVRRLTGTGQLRELGNDKSLARKMGRRYGAEILILGTVSTSSHPFRVGDVEMFTNRAVVSARVIKSDTGDVMASASEENKLAGGRDAYEEPLQRAAQKLAEKLTEKAVAWWQKELGGSADFVLVVEGLSSYGQLNRLKSILSEETRGVQRVNQRSFDGSRAELDVQLKGKLRFLANDLVNLNLDGRRFTVKRQSANMLVVRLR
ncbi:MAG: hypothetical protein DRH20_04945 [Deltaproteobacteria bacterium]|nr:MAG: hypothetical protein DRH20_04945 [Deltaproteobacteria bacterium]